MKAGSLKRRLWIDEPTVSRDEDGGEVTTFSPYAQVAASIKPVGGREALVAGVNLAVMDTRIVIRWSPQMAAVTSKWRARYGSTTYDIVNARAVDAGRREIELLCKSGANDG